MKAVLTIILLWGLLPGFASAQKAYHAIQYKASFDAHRLWLTLGNGYLAASKIKLLPAGGKPVLFYPDSGIPDDKDQLIFRAKDHPNYFILNSIQERYDRSPEIVVGRYWSGKQWSAIKFVLGR